MRSKKYCDGQDSLWQHDDRLYKLLDAIAGGLPISYVNGGPVSAIWGWVIVTMGNVLVGLSVAELASSYPLAGGPYLW